MMYFIGIDSDDGILALLAEVQHLHEVTHLELQGLEMPAEAFSALAACSSLRYLDISYNSVPAGTWQQLFAPGRRLPLLQFLDVSCVSLDSDPYGMATLPLTAANAHRLVDCCSGLQQLHAHGTLHDAAALAALSALSASAVSR
jgi:hypothetical protein